ncbi:hypothetical protein J2R96_001317 [Bradyrhizobium elkanii]|nr:hypothetical protein [Bradyrhizobium elkanii]
MWGLPAGAPIDQEVWRPGVHPDDLVRTGCSNIKLLRAATARMNGG